MSLLRRHWFTELVNKGMFLMGGVYTDPNPYSTSKITFFSGTTSHENGPPTNDNFPDTETINDYHTDEV